MKRTLSHLYAVGILLGTIASVRSPTPVFGQAHSSPLIPENVPDGWQTAAPRAELRPQFSFKRHGGADGKGTLIIQADAREGLDGYWTRTFAVSGGRVYRFSARRKVEHVTSPRRSVVARLL